jgi:PPP family 3-phenylpropionic acid transporter
MLKLFYLCYFITLGVSVPFFPAYLRQLGLSGSEVSTLLALSPVLQLGAPLAWGWLADRTQRPDRILRLLCLVAFAASVPVVFVRTMPALFVVYLVLQLFAGSISSLADSLAVERSKQGAHYGRIRAFGSASFVLTCLVVGWWLDRRGLTGDALVPELISAGYGLSFLAALGLRGRGREDRPHLRDVRRLLADRRFVLLLVIAGVHWAALVPYHGFFGILLHDRGFSARLTSYAFFAGSGSEILVFVLFSQLRARFALSRILAVTFAVSAVRWWLSASTHSAGLMVAIQLAHALSYGAFWASAMAWMADCVPSKVRATGQVLFATVTGLGSGAGLLLAGRIYDAAGGAGAAFVLSGFIELVPLVLVLASSLPRGARAALGDE